MAITAAMTVRLDAGQIGELVLSKLSGPSKSFAVHEAGPGFPPAAFRGVSVNDERVNVTELSELLRSAAPQRQFEIEFDASNDVPGPINDAITGVLEHLKPLA